MKLFVVLMLVQSIFINFSYGFNNAEYFEKKCSSCHTIGGGDDTGPDLKGVAERRKEEWIIKFIKNSEEVIKSGDPVANELFAKFKNKKMPAQELSDDEVKQLIEFIKLGKGGGAVTYRPALQSNPFDVETGKALFSGMKKLENGGPACISCHSAGTSFGALGGGTLGPDLVLTSYESYEDKGFNKVIAKISFPSMVEVYASKSLTENENYYIRSFLFSEYQKHKDLEDHSAGKPTKKFIFLGVVLGGIFILAMDFIWRKRRKKTRRPY